jgi:hypothetical protein
LIGEGFQDRLVVEEHGAELVRAGLQDGFEIGVDVWGWLASGPDVLGLLILVSQSGCHGLWEVLGDEAGREAWEGIEVTFAYGTKKGRWCGASEGCVVIGGEFLFWLVETKDAVGQVGLRRAYRGFVDGYGPKTVGHAFTRNDEFVVFEDFYVIPVENGDAIVVAELGEGDEGAGTQIVENESRLGCRGEKW